MTKLDNFGKLADIDTKSGVFRIFEDILSIDAVDHQIFDITLEGLSYIWLEHPDLIL